MAWTSEADSQRGREALVVFHNYCVNHFSSYRLTFDQLLTAVTSQKGAKFLPEAIGQMIRESDMSLGKVEDAMEALAKRGGGRIPDNWMSWLNALADEASKVTFIDAASYVTVESAKDVAKGFAEVGDTILDTAKSIGFVAPLALTAAFLFIIYRKAKTL